MGGKNKKLNSKRLEFLQIIKQKKGIISINDCFCSGFKSSDLSFFTETGITKLCVKNNVVYHRITLVGMEVTRTGLLPEKDVLFATNN